MRTIKPATFIAFARKAALLPAALAAAAVVRGAAAQSLPSVSHAFRIEVIAHVADARELAVTPNGDLLVGTLGDQVYIVPHAEAEGSAGSPRVFATFSDRPAAGVALSGAFLYVGTQFGVFRIPYRTGDLKARGSPEKLASVRPSGVSSDHVTTSVAVAKGVLYASVGSSCNACQPDLDPTRATIGRVAGAKYQIIAHNVRNAIALTANENTGSLWAAVAGEDDLPLGHPYEIFDDVSAHPWPVNYGWPYCYEDQKVNPVPRWHGRDCRDTAIPRVVMPAYETPIGGVFYPQHPQGRYAFPPQYAGGAFVTLHGSWHGPPQGLSGFMPPRVVFIPVHGDVPAHPVDWSDPTTQWNEFAGGFQSDGSDNRIGRPTGVAVGPQGDLFIADDQSGAIYRVRPRR